MHDPQPGFPTPESDKPPPGQGKTLLWVALVLGGLMLLLICSLGGLAAYFITNTPFSQIGELMPQPGAPSAQVDQSAPQDSESVLPAGETAPQAATNLPAPPESPRAAEEKLPLGLVQIEEDFDDPTTRWDQSRSRVVDGGYELRVDTPNYDSYGLYLGNGRVSDFDMAVDVQQVAGDATSEYGIRFRQSGPGDYLMFSISGSGYYRLLRVSDDEYNSVVPWTFDSRIKTGPDTTNRLRLVARGSSITGFINDTQVVVVEDDVNASGQLTLGLTTFDQGGLVVRFDNIEGQAEGSDLREDFSDPEATLWSIGGATITNGAYELFAGGGIQAWQQPLPSRFSKVENFVLEVDATLVNGPQDEVAYGVMFGDGGSFDFYSLFLFPQGNLGLFISDSAGNRGALIEPTPFEAIKSGIGETNKIRVEVRDNVIQISINGEALPEIESPFVVEGMVGMIVSSGETGNVQARFDNFSLRELSLGPQRQV